MKTKKLPLKWIKCVAKQEESAMGLQDVEIDFTDGTTEKHTIYYSTEVLVPIDVKNIVDIRVTHHTKRFR